MVSHLFTLHPHNEIIYTAPWFTDMLPYLGQTPVLDSSMCAFILQLVGRSKKNASDLCRSRDLYVASLNNLQRALNHPVAWRSTETLAATIMCSLFELFAGTRDPLTWMLHVSGMSKLIQQRGPASFQSMIDKALLRSARPLLVSETFFSVKSTGRLHVILTAMFPYRSLEICSLVETASLTNQSGVGFPRISL